MNTRTRRLRRQRREARLRGSEIIEFDELRPFVAESAYVATLDDLGSYDAALLRLIREPR